MKLPTGVTGLVLAAVAARHGLPPHRLLEGSRERRFSWARQEVMYILRRWFGYSTTAATRAVMRWDHTTAIWASRVVRQRAAEDVSLHPALEAIAANIRRQLDDASVGQRRAA